MRRRVNIAPDRQACQSIRMPHERRPKNRPGAGPGRHLWL